jgi:nicotinate-nucleotide adenylyltransferase
LDARRFSCNSKLANLNAKLKYGLFGGSFDPVHHGHLLVAQAACEEIGLDRLFFIPAAQSPFKPDNAPAPANERVRLLRLALAGCNRYEVDEQEISRGGISYTVDTVRAYRKRFPDVELFYLTGADHISQLPKWREAEELAKQVEFVIVPRPGEAVEHKLPSPFRVRMLKGFPLSISSSQIRERVKAGLPIKTFVPAAVAEAIRNYRLYL